MSKKEFIKLATASLWHFDAKFESASGGGRGLLGPGSSFKVKHIFYLPSCQSVKAIFH